MARGGETGYGWAMRTICLILLTVWTLGAKAQELVNIRAVQPQMLEEVRYATKYNFTGEALYPFPAVYIHKDLVEPLRKVQEELAEKGLGLKIYDGYRPLSVQQKMWDLIRDERYVSNPAKNKGRHTRGTAVDVTLVDRMGNELKMPTGFDDFTEKAHRKMMSWSAEERANAELLEAVMVKNGFIAYPYEWWHFDYQGWEGHEPQDISFEELATAGRK